MTTIEITAVRMSQGGTLHSHITDYRWRDRADGKTGDSNKPTMVKWIDDKSGVAFVGSGRDEVRVGVVHPDSSPPYLRTYADGDWTNNLLALPRF